MDTVVIVTRKDWVACGSMARRSPRAPISDRQPGICIRSLKFPSPFGKGEGQGEGSSSQVRPVVLSNLTNAVLSFIEFSVSSLFPRSIF